MADAWNRGNGEMFAARFADDADFVAFEGTHLHGRRQIAVFHQQIFDTVVKGSRIETEVKLVRFLGPDMAAMHSVVRVTLRGETAPSRSRDSMQLFVVAKRTGRWIAEAMLNACKVTLDRQGFLDEVDSLPEEAQRRVGDVVSSLKRALR
jgi:uncharacterized protein (TIGR02246 family)